MEPTASAEHSGHVFICYATGDSERVAALERVFTVNAILVWRSASSLRPGDDWAAKIRNAIKNESIAFLACFSTRSVARQSSYQNDELLVAIDEFQSRSHDSSWLIPVRLDDCQIPGRQIGGGRTLASIQRADLFGPQREQNTDQLVTRIKEICRRSPETENERVEEPVASTAEPARPGWMTALDVFDRTYQE